MKKNLSIVSFSLGILFSLIAWYNYGRLIYVTTNEPDYLTMQQYNDKYYSHYPFWLRGINEVNLMSIILLALAILLMIIVINYGKPFLKITSYVLLIINAVVLLMIAIAYA